MRRKRIVAVVKVVLVLGILLGKRHFLVVAHVTVLLFVIGL
jgi:hypothetical protein